MSIYIVRHGHSIGNKLKIVQGNNYDLPLSKMGKEEVEVRRKRLGLKKCIHIDSILSSPLIRAKETAQILNKYAKKPIFYFESLREINTGVLIGKKQKLAEIYPEYLRIWEERGDLDKIPNAEKGLEAEARSLYFIERYFDQFNHNEIVVSHAAFIRVLINTIYGRNRNHPIDYSHDTIHRIDFNPWTNIQYEKLVLAKTSEAYKIKTGNSYFVMKRISNYNHDDSSFQYQISRLLNHEDILISPMLYSGINPLNNTIQIYRYLKGKHIYGKLTPHQEKALISMIKKLARKLQSISNNFVSKFPSILDIETIINNIQRDTKDNLLHIEGKKILENQKFRESNTKEKKLVHYDLHRANIIFNDKSPYILDLGSFCLGSLELQFASLLMPFFLLEEGMDFNYKKYFSFFDCDPLELTWLMRARNYIGLSFFNKKIIYGYYNQDDLEIYQKYISSKNKLEFIIHELS